jgi:Rrf2 family protein
MAQHHNEGAIQLSDIAKRQDVSQKYLEQIIIPLKKANYLKGIRGAKGGYILNKHPREIIALLEGGTALCECSENSTSCKRADTCLTRNVWIEAAQAMFKTLNSITFLDIIKEGKLK